MTPPGSSTCRHFPFPEKIICFGLNYREHASESGFEAPTYPALFGRFPSSLIGHNAPIVRPDVSDQLDYEGELVAIIGKPGRNIPVERALEHVAGYSIFNDASIRDYQFKSAQWTIGKNFDSTGAFGPVFVTADELEAGAKGLSPDHPVERNRAAKCLHHRHDFRCSHPGFLNERRHAPQAR